MGVFPYPIDSADRNAIVLRGTATAPGTCGELVQGTIGGEPFLITCPIDIWSEVTVELGQWCEPSRDLEKSYHALQMTLDYLGQPAYSGFILRNSLLPESKGMASSSADIAATCLATARAFGQELRAEIIAKIATNIEPSDGIMYPGIIICNHLTGEVKECLGPAPPLKLVIADPGGTVDTIRFNHRKDLASKNLQKEPMVRQATDLVTRGLLTKDWEMLGRGASISAQANQLLLPKPHLDQWLRWAAELQALGVLVAHSGTVMGMIMHPDRKAAEEAAQYIRHKRPEWQVWQTAMVSGGLK